MSVVVSDTSPIYALHHLELLHVLSKLYGRVVIPPAVVNELRAPRSGVALIDLERIAGFEVVEPRDRERVRRLLEKLDAGESEAIVLAMEIGATTLIIDERAGREEAVAAGLMIVGTLGVLLRSKREGLVPVIDPLIDRLEKEIRFFVAPDLREEVRKLAGERRG